ncbi:MAG: DNA alkylation repair protein [Candidatus Latescibacteria bacterium]|nr:DNA alkylation repair protein [bacterium]MBD3425337.1 DNA alkylation repair protein [Candidatus Latescibacterota bacterium]
MDSAQIIRELNLLADPERAVGMERVGISFSSSLGVSLPDLRKMASRAGMDHPLALRLWEVDLREARILAGMIDDPSQVTEKQMESWAGDFDNWEICDQSCNNLFRKTAHAWPRAREWTRRDEEFVKRAGFVLAAVLAVGRREPHEGRFEAFLPLIVEGSSDGRNYVKKGVDWALRQIGKRSPYLNSRAIETARDIGRLDSGSARWIAASSLRELTGEKVQRRFRGRPV